MEDCELVDKGTSNLGVEYVDGLDVFNISDVRLPNIVAKEVVSTWKGALEGEKLLEVVSVLISVGCKLVEADSLTLGCEYVEEFGCGGIDEPGVVPLEDVSAG